jgi:branched-chain amino acid transport system permease protein
MMQLLLPQLLIQGIITGSFYAIAGMSWGIIYRTTRIFHFSHHLVFTVSGYTAALLTFSVGLHYLVGFLAAIAVAIVFGVSIDRFLYRELRRRGANREVVRQEPHELSQ